MVYYVINKCVFRIKPKKETITIAINNEEKEINGT